MDVVYSITVYIDFNPETLDRTDRGFPLKPPIPTLVNGLDSTILEWNPRPQTAKILPFSGRRFSQTISRRRRRRGRGISRYNLHFPVWRSMESGGEVGWYVFGPNQEHVGPYALSELQGMIPPPPPPLD